jgi:tetratricopeptide (TPR) repeat protein
VIRRGAWAVLVVVAACHGPQRAETVLAGALPAAPTASLPRAPGAFGPSLLRLDGKASASFGDDLTDVDTCSTCHPDVAKQWSASAHSFSSFTNPIYRASVELIRHDLGRKASQLCGSCHDVALETTGALLGEIPARDLRSHSGVTCRVCHGIDQVDTDGNGSYTLRTQPIYTPDVTDPASVERHRRSVSLRPLGAKVCGACHRAFLSPDLGTPVHITGVDEPTAWRASAYDGGDLARVDDVDRKTCIDCHMAPEAASPDEAAAHDGKVHSHRFLGGHTWMAGMRGDADQLARLRAHLEGVASIDVAAAIEPPDAAPADAPRTAAGAWVMPADGAAARAGTRVGLEVVVRNRLVGHRFPGGVMDMQDTWIEVEVSDAHGRRLASSGLHHAADPADPDRADGAHVLRSLPVDDQSRILDLHELARFRAVIFTQAIAPRDAVVVRYALDVPRGLAPGDLPLRVDARLRHRSRSLADQQVVCDESKTEVGRAFAAGALDARGIDLDPCEPQPITEITSTTAWLGGRAPAGTPSPARPRWQRTYELGMALVGEVTEELDEAKAVLGAAAAEAPAGRAGDRARGMIDVQLGWVLGRQGRTDEALAILDRARRLLPDAPAAIDAAAADALMRVWRWREAVAPAEAAAGKAPGATASWVVLARVLGSVGDDRGALEAARRGLALDGRQPDLLRSQAVALRALGSPLADAALAAYDRFRVPDDAPDLRIRCADVSARCARERQIGHTHVLAPIQH